MFLADNGVDTDWWTGATDLGREGHWYWAGSLATVGDFLWYKPTNQPNGGIAHNCMFLENGGSYEFYGNDYGCTEYPRFFHLSEKMKASFRGKRRLQIPCKMSNLPIR